MAHMKERTLAVGRAICSVVVSVGLMAMNPVDEMATQMVLKKADCWGGYWGRQ